MGTLDAQAVEEPSRVLGGVGEGVAALDLVGQPVPTPGQGEHPEPVAQVRRELREDVGGAAQAGQQQQRVSVAAPVQVVEADAVEDDELVGGNVDGTRHPVTVPRRARTETAAERITTGRCPVALVDGAAGGFPSEKPWSRSSSRCYGAAAPISITEDLPMHIL